MSSPEWRHHVDSERFLGQRVLAGHDLLDVDLNNVSGLGSAHFDRASHNVGTTVHWLGGRFRSQGLPWEPIVHRLHPRVTLDEFSVVSSSSVSEHFDTNGVA